MERTARLFVLSGPAGAGKGSILGLVRSWYPELHVSVSATTRSPRAGEVEGVSYHFLSHDEFRSLVEQDAFLEWAEVHGELYGTMRSEVDAHLAAGESVMLEIDVQGAFNIRSQYPNAVLLFVEPPSFEILEQRLRGRKSETEEKLQERLRNARQELALKDRYDERIVNDVLEDAAHTTLELIRRYETEEDAQHGSHEA